MAADTTDFISSDDHKLAAAALTNGVRELITNFWIEPRPTPPSFVESRALTLATGLKEAWSRSHRGPDASVEEHT